MFNPRYKAVQNNGPKRSFFSKLYASFYTHCPYKCRLTLSNSHICYNSFWKGKSKNIHMLICNLIQTK